MQMTPGHESWREEERRKRCFATKGQKEDERKEGETVGEY
jgi:hypothetical protein